MKEQLIGCLDDAVETYYHGSCIDAANLFKHCRDLLFDTDENTLNPFKLGVMYYEIGEFERAIKFLEKADDEDHELFPDGEAHHIMAKSYNRLGKLEEAIEESKQSVAMAESNGNQKRLVHYYSELGNLLFEAHDYVVACELLSKSNEIADEIGSLYMKIKNLSRLGNVELAMGNMDEAEISFHEAMRLSDTQNNTKGAIKTRGRLGKISLLKGNHQDAQRYFAESIQICRDNMQPLIAGDLSNNLGRLGDTYFYQGKNAEALSYFDEALQIARDYGIPISLMNNLVRVGAALYKTADYKRSKEYFEEALALARSHDNQRLIKDILGYLGNLHFLRGNNNAAMDLYSQAYEISDRLSDSKGVINNAGRIGKILLRRGEIVKARSFIVRVNEEADKIGNSLGIMKAQGRLGDIQYYLDDKKAIEHYELALEIATSIGNPYGRVNNELRVAMFKAFFCQDDSGALAYVDSALDVAESVPYVSGIAKCKMRKAVICMVSNDKENASSSASESLEIATKHGYTDNIILYNIIVGKITDNQDMIYQALEMSKQHGFAILEFIAATNLFLSGRLDDTELERHKNIGSNIYEGNPPITSLLRSFDTTDDLTHCVSDLSGYLDRQLFN
jgi:tetratricopeptide (TPR) repeat protein